MIAHLRQSLAVRLGALYALVFALGAAAVFAVLYWFLADALEAKERALVERRAQDYAALYERGGAAAVRAAAEATAEANSLLVRIIGTGGNIVFARVPPDWVETQIQRIPLPGAFSNLQWQQVVQTVRIPRDAEKDFAVASCPLADGRSLQVVRSTDNRAALLAPLRRTFLTIGAGALGLAALVGGGLAWRFTRPLREVNATARRIVATGDLHARVPAPAGGGELGELVRQLNSVLAQNAALIEAQRETLDNLAHDLRTPLARLRGTADLALQNQADPVAAREALADCLEESERVLRLLETLLDVSAATTGTLPLRRERTDLGAILADAADLYREVAEEKRIALHLDTPAPVPVEADPLRLGQAVANLIDNALKYTPAGGAVRLGAQLEAGSGVLTVSDTGPGVPAEEREKIWRRLYRGDASRSQRGLGLGLSLVKAIVEAHRGTVAVDDAPGGGARFSVRLPAESRPA
ncbi:MAG: HAMP domain-containing histidine kinase [Opitutae bacterium]|nr:HAMP domain-containing histidine kinase [Opitutae bacterium]